MKPHKLFNATGIRLTANQIQILRDFLRAVLALAGASLLTLLSGRPLWTVSRDCVAQENHYLAVGVAHSDCAYHTNAGVPIWLIVLVIILVVYGLVPLLVHFVTYVAKLIFRPQFREAEMAGSVNYLEEDEREQLLTMRATRRSYMVLNFAILVGWLFSLLWGKLDFALLLFGVQLVGALSYRREISGAAS